MRRPPLLALLLLTPAVTASEDPRLTVVRLQIEGRIEEALEASEEILQMQPESAKQWGFPYLRGHLLEQLGRSEDAGNAYAESLTQPGPLEPFARYRLARIHASAGRSAVATDILVTLLSGPNPSQLTAPATTLLVRTVEEADDCRGLQQRAFGGLRHCCRGYASASREF